MEYEEFGVLGIEARLELAPHRAGLFCAAWEGVSLHPMRSFFEISRDSRKLATLGRKPVSGKLQTGAAEMLGTEFYL